MYITCELVEGESRALEEYRLFAAKALECLLIGKPTLKGVPGALPGELTDEGTTPMPDMRRLPGAVSTLSDRRRCPKAADTRK